MRDIRIVEQHFIVNAPRLPITREIVYAVSWFEEMSIIAVIHADGKARPTLYRDGYIGSQGVWGCAICEQWHPEDVETCPLARGGKPIEDVLFGPFSANDVPEFYVPAKQVAS